MPFAGELCERAHGVAAVTRLSESFYTVRSDDGVGADDDGVRVVQPLIYGFSLSERELADEITRRETGDVFVAVGCYDLELCAEHFKKLASARRF